MRDPFKRRLTLAALVAPGLDHDHRRDRLQAVLHAMGQLLHQHRDSLVCDRVLALKPHALGDVFDRQQDLLYFVVRSVDRACIEHHDATAD